MKCFIIDDDTTTRFLIADMLESIGGTEVIGSFESPIQALENYLKQKPHVIFLDVEMPGLTGVEFANSILPETKIVFISSKKEYAVDAFGLNAVDYLLKPITLPRLTQAILKLKSVFEPENSTTDEGKEHVFLKTGDGYKRIRIEDITYVEALGDYVQIYTAESKFIMNGTLKNAYSKLLEELFKRVHRSYIVNMNKIEKIEDGAIVIGKKIIPIGRSYKKDFSDSINTFDL
ncbi:two component transcriptional regulator, LytTR family [Lishizhenia tianjinensis]|uniref:Two component transcriptional regulator, LytTR family n=1 Tax=Lishizhenia tianjinensis TaxID=477690 RepID=A0A1I7AXU4_9FLAO|nr:LytTR family DNA-binding domain-containing protein [Lishizhenia tianjinensis]SFT79735.1 two component transcriptional regulator, LytTR family [Lishizhenia tianjinensis]